MPCRRWPELRENRLRIDWGLANETAREIWNRRLTYLGTFIQGILYKITPTLQNLTRKEKEDWEEATGRATFAKQLITDANPGMLDMMTESTYPEQRGRHPAFGETVLQAARKLDDFEGEGE